MSSLRGGDLNGRIFEELGQQFADLYGASGVTDAEPGSMTVDEDHNVYVRSRSRGRVRIGSINDKRLLKIASTYSDELEAILATMTSGVARGFTARQIRQTVLQLRKEIGRAPTREETAVRLNTSEATLKRAVRDLGIGPWPPSPPED